jgi:uncharacterized protein YdcH (DUF465 family)
VVMPCRSTVLAKANVVRGSLAGQAAMFGAVAEQEVCPMIVVTADDRLTELEARHRQLHDEVNQLERRAFLTPEEQRLIADLKKQKLMAKDELYAARRAAQTS